MAGGTGKKPGEGRTWSSIKENAKAIRTKAGPAGHAQGGDGKRAQFEQGQVAGRAHRPAQLRSASASVTNSTPGTSTPRRRRSPRFRSTRTWRRYTQARPETIARDSRVVTATKIVVLQDGHGPRVETTSKKGRIGGSGFHGRKAQDQTCRKPQNKRKGQEETAGVCRTEQMRNSTQSGRMGELCWG